MVTTMGRRLAKLEGLGGKGEYWRCFRVIGPDGTDGAAVVAGYLGSPPLPSDLIICRQIVGGDDFPAGVVEARNLRSGLPVVGVSGVPL